MTNNLYLSTLESANVDIKCYGSKIRIHTWVSDVLLFEQVERHTESHALFLYGTADTVGPLLNGPNLTVVDTCNMLPNHQAPGSRHCRILKSNPQGLLYPLISSVHVRHLKQFLPFLP